MKEIKYNKVGDFEFPELKQERPLPNLSRFGREYLRILKEKHPGHYLALRAKDELNEELIRVDKELNQRYETLIEQYKVSRNITEELKEQDQMGWVQEMNNIKSCVEELIFKEVVQWRWKDKSNILIGIVDLMISNTYLKMTFIEILKNSKKTLYMFKKKW